MPFLSTLQQRKRESPAPCHAVTYAPSSQQTAALEFDSSSTELSVVLAKAAYSGHGVSYWVPFFSTKWFLLNEPIKGIKVHVFTNWCSVQLTIVQVVLGIPETGKTAKCLMLFDQFSLLWAGPSKSPKAPWFSSVGTLKGSVKLCLGHVEILISTMSWAVAFKDLPIFNLSCILFFYTCVFKRCFRCINNILPF